MERSFRSVSSLALLISMVAYADTTFQRPVAPKYVIRSQGANSVRRNVGTVGHRNLHDMDKFYFDFNIVPEYHQSFDSDEIAECLFGDKLCNKVLRIQGSRVVDRDKNALLADYLYLPTDFDSCICFDPSIRNFSLDMNFYFGLDNWHKGLYFWVQFPITWTKWDLDCCENVKDAGKNDHCAGYFTPNELKRDRLLGQAVEYFLGCAPEAQKQTVDYGSSLTEDFTVKFNPLRCAKICCGDSDSETTVPEFRFAFGWNFLLDEDYHLGLNIQASAPTGHEARSNFLFSAQNGNDDHWELGAGLGFHFIFWRSEDEDRHVGFYFDANVTHLFADEQCRCFDLCGKPLSRYMLAEKLGTPVVNLEEDGNADNVPSAQFQNEFAPVANVTELQVDVSVKVQADVAAWINYTHEKWSWDLGYNFWARSCEKIRRDCDCPQFDENWALKGDAQVYGFVESGSDDRRAIPLSATQKGATVCGGLNFGREGVEAGSSAEDTGKTNPEIDNPKLTQDANDVDLVSQPTGSTQINSSFDPCFIREADIDFARVRGISHKVFSHLQYTWKDRDSRWIPYLGVGFEVEFGSDDDKCETDCKVCPPSCDVVCDTGCDTKCPEGTCLDCAVSQWGVFLKGGVTFS